MKNACTWLGTSDRTRCSTLWDLCSIAVNTPTLVVLCTTLDIKILSIGTATRKVLARTWRRCEQVYMLLLTRCERLFCKVS